MRTEKWLRRAGVVMCGARHCFYHSLDSCRGPCSAVSSKGARENMGHAGGRSGGSLGYPCPEPQEVQEREGGQKGCREQFRRRLEGGRRSEPLFSVWAGGGGRGGHLQRSARSLGRGIRCTTPPCTGSAVTR